MHYKELFFEPLLEPFCEDPNDSVFSKEHTKAARDWMDDQFEIYEIFARD